MCIAKIWIWLYWRCAYGEPITFVRLRFPVADVQITTKSFQPHTKHILKNRQTPKKKVKEVKQRCIASQPSPYVNAGPYVSLQQKSIKRKSFYKKR